MIALFVGHSRFIRGRRDGGAVSVGGVNEWTYNCGLAEMIKMEIYRQGKSAEIINNYKGVGYSKATDFVAAEVIRLNASLAVELHFNDVDDSTVHGHEWLYCAVSKNSKRLASLLETNFHALLPDMTRRGVRPRQKKEDGGGFLWKTRCPAVICEPFFGSNKADWKVATDKKQTIAAAIARGLCQY